MKTAQELFAEARQRITEVTPQEVQALRRDGAAFALVDVREGNEWQMGRIPGATFIPRGVLEGTIEGRVPRETPVVLYCASGNRSALAADALQRMGYTNVASVAGGWRAWQAAGAPVERD